MITKTFRTTGDKLKVNIPEQLNEITLGQLMDMQATENMSDLDAIHILSGVPLTDLQSIKNYHDLEHFNAHILKLSGQIKEIFNSGSLPKTITFGLGGKSKTVSVISNLSIQPAGAFMAARDVITDAINNHIFDNGEDDWKETFSPSLKACGLVLAHYFYCPVTGKAYNEYEAEQFLDEVKKLPFTDVLPISKYFFLNYPNLLKPKISFWRHIQLLWKKRLELSSFKNSGLLTR